MIDASPAEVSFSLAHSAGDAACTTSNIARIMVSRITRLSGRALIKDIVEKVLEQNS
jgi:hypothetical protein